MKISISRMLSFTVIVALLFGLIACGHPHYQRGPMHGHRGHMPPGQVKKYYGSKSAKPYAPGQQKKYYRKRR
ncbi:hypothetical protein ABDK00_015635 [Niabella insulamsoli]|uniref:hypothetical protein n=1 Tax=Niabella insulamsoli TaxID=3144874 RepID=UPI0031FCB8D6